MNTTQVNNLKTYAEYRLKGLKSKRYTNSEEGDEILILSRLVCEAKNIPYGILYFNENEAEIENEDEPSLDYLIQSWNTGVDDDITDLLDMGYVNIQEPKEYCQAVQGPLNKLEGLKQDLIARKATIIRLAEYTNPSPVRS